MNNKKEIPVESLHRGLQILEYISGFGGEGAMLSEIADAMNLKRTTVHNLLKTLVNSGYAVNNGEGKYSLGWKIDNLSNNRILMGICGGGMPSIQAVLNGITENVGESLVLAALLNGRRKVISRTQSGQLVDIHSSVLEQEYNRFWELETGLVLAAYACPEEQEQLISLNTLPANTSQSKLNGILASIRKAGYCSLPHNDIYASAVPVLDEQGRLLAALGINQPLFRHETSNEPQLLEKLKAGAAKLASIWNIPQSHRQ